MRIELSGLDNARVDAIEYTRESEYPRITEPYTLKIVYGPRYDTILIHMDEYTRDAIINALNNPTQRTL